MPRVARLMACSAIMLAVCASSAPADPIKGCSLDATSVAQYGPRACDGKLISNLTATVGGVDVSHSDQLGMISVLDNYPPDPRWMPLFNYPVAGEFPYTVNSSTPLEVGYTISSLTGFGPTVAADMGLENLQFTAFHGLVETLLTFANGHSLLMRLGWNADGTFLGDRANVSFDGVTSLSVRTRVFGMALRGGGGPGFAATLAAPGNPSPVPEPATMTLIASGLAMAIARRRRRRSTSSTD